MVSYPELGFVLSKGSNGIKKDMKEAAKWYRMAVSRLKLGVEMKRGEES